MSKRENDLLGWNINTRRMSKGCGISIIHEVEEADMADDNKLTN
jgi:hypothetical protein